MSCQTATNCSLTREGGGGRGVYSSTLKRRLRKRSPFQQGELNCRRSRPDSVLTAALTPTEQSRGRLGLSRKQWMAGLLTKFSASLWLRSCRWSRLHIFNAARSPRQSFSLLSYKKMRALEHVMSASEGLTARQSQVRR